MSYFSVTRQGARRTSIALALALASAFSYAPSAVAGSGGAGLGTTSNATSVRAVFARTLRTGQNGTDVQQLQTWLSELGYAVAVTGHFGSET